ncbi:MAG TPA: hypothetical protein VG894_02880 [Bauldia sp.]|nr:hypothetical protein [Bauldia sp.]
MQQRATTGELVAKLRHRQQIGHSDWVIDIALGTPAAEPKAPDGEEAIRWTEPALIQVAIELKSIWTEHGKARKNRLRDFNAFAGHAHEYSRRTVAAAFLVVNASEYFLSPLNANRGEALTQHGRPRRTAGQLAKETIDLFRSIHIRDDETDAPGLEGIGVVVIEHDNIAALANQPTLQSVARRYEDRARVTRVAPSPPSLKVGDPLHYSTMIQRICAAYTARFGR